MTSRTEPEKMSIGDKKLDIAIKNMFTRVSLKVCSNLTFLDRFSLRFKMG